MSGVLCLGCASALEQADQAYVQQDWDRAATQYERANQSVQTPAQAEQIRLRLMESRQRAGAQHLDQAKKFANIGDLRHAAGHAERAFSFDATPEVQAFVAWLRPLDGARLQQDGKAAFEDGRWKDAVTSLSAAQERAPTEEGGRLLATARERLKDLEPANFKITIHSATILPFKPASKRPWDGIGGSVRNPDELLVELARSAADPTRIATVISAAKVASAAVDEPDCYLIVTVAGQRYGAPRGNTQPNSLQPLWDLSFPVYDANALDERIVNIEVRDQDLQDDDTVGSYQTTVGNLVRDPTRAFSLVRPDGRLEAEGLLVLKVSAERF